MRFEAGGSVFWPEEIYAVIYSFNPYKNTRTKRQKVLESSWA
jgi:hypothetical protein